jgi:transcription elongation factor GreA
LLQSSQTVTLLDAIGIYVSSLKAKATQAPSQQELLRFAQWCGSDRIIAEMQPSVVEEYGSHAASSAARPDASERLREVRKFLTFARKKGLIEQNLAQHLRIPKAKVAARSDQSLNGPAAVELTAEGHAQIESELEVLRSRRGPMAQEIRRAAADKDVRENAPLEAAREQLGQLETRIGDMEKTLEAAVIVDTSGRRSKSVGVGSKVVVKDVDSGRETSYTLVGAFEANPLEGKISDVSPVGKALMKQSVGQQVSVSTPRGTIKYLIKRVTS